MNMDDDNALVVGLKLIDPILQFLLKATGEIDVPLSSLVKAFPSQHRQLLKHIPALMSRGVIRWEVMSKAELIHRGLEGKVNRCTNDNHSDLSNITHNDDSFFHKCLEECLQSISDSNPSPTNVTTSVEIVVGFPYRHNSKSSLKPDDASQSLHGCTKAAANRRLKHLQGNVIRLTVEEPKAPAYDSGQCPTQESKLGKSIGDQKKENVAVVELIDLVSSHSSEFGETFHPSHSATHAVPERKGHHQTIAASTYGFQQFKETREEYNYQTNSAKVVMPLDSQNKIENIHLQGDVQRNLQPCLDINTSESHRSDSMTETIIDLKSSQYKKQSYNNRNNVPTSSDVFKSAKSDTDHEKSDYEKESNHAIAALLELFSSDSCNTLDPKQASYAGCRPEREAQYQKLSAFACSRIPSCLGDILKLDLSSSLDGKPITNDCQFNRLYTHQAQAIESIFTGCHTLISTGTGSGKSLCFLIPVLSDVIQSDQLKASTGCVSLLLFPTKALAQDQLSKLRNLLAMNELAQQHCRPGIIDGDTPLECREAIVNECNIILTNPDTLHCHILSNWKKYKVFLSRLRYIAIDELHMYSGIFGSHVRMVLARLVRLCCCSSSKVEPSYAISNTQHRERQRSSGNATIKEKPMNIGAWKSPIFIGCSATVAFPEEHFRFLCPITVNDDVCILDSAIDGSPCPTKYYFLWNPPTIEQRNNLSRRHAADETAILLAQAVKLRIRSVAFCATRMIAEWVYEKCYSFLEMSDKSRLEIYRGGYSTEVRRQIEQRLFQNQIIAVVATSALEVGVDIGGIDLTFHCGYPGSYNSLTQQAGRAGRDKLTNKPSFSVIVCFNSPAEQHLWQNPRSLLTNNKLRPSSLPMNASIVQGHLLCASEESPLTGSHPACILYGDNSSCLQSDKTLFGGDPLYDEIIEKLMVQGSLVANKFSTASSVAFDVFSAHPSTNGAWKNVSIRSIEPLNYSIVDLHHPMQSERTDRIHHQDAVLDTIPYSRVFYHAYPGAIIVHRGKKYEIVGISRPPRPGSTYFGDLMAFAKKVTAKYSTAALSVTTLTIVKYLGRLETSCDKTTESGIVQTISPSFLAGHGIVNVKKQVHGYKKLSLVDRSELSREEIKLPPMEYDSNSLWIDVDATKLRSEIKNFDEGVHALSHAIIALAPVFVPCSYSDIDCDHSHYNCSRIIVYDTRAGGSGTSARLWDQIFEPNGLIESAIGLLTHCPSRCHHSGYVGCPACIQAIPCSDFQNGLSIPAAIAIARHLLRRIKSNICSYQSESSLVNSPCTSISPRRKKRLVDAADLERARKRHILIGRPSWHTDE